MFFISFLFHILFSYYDFIFFKAFFRLIRKHKYNLYQFTLNWFNFI